MRSCAALFLLREPSQRPCLPQPTAAQPRGEQYTWVADIAGAHVLAPCRRGTALVTRAPIESLRRRMNSGRARSSLTACSPADRLRREDGGGVPEGRSILRRADRQHAQRAAQGGAHAGTVRSPVACATSTLISLSLGACGTDTRDHCDDVFSAFPPGPGQDNQFLFPGLFRKLEPSPE